MAAAAATLRDRVTFRTNVTETVTPTGEGTPQDGRNGIEFRYMLEGHRIMWVPEEAHRQIERADTGFPSTFEITKRKEGWTVVHVAEEPSYGYGQASPTKQPPTPPPAPVSAPRKPPETAARPNAAADPYNASLYTCLCAAITVTKAAEEYAATKGHPVAFATGDIRALATTLFINAAGGR